MTIEEAAKEYSRQDLSDYESRNQHDKIQRAFLAGTRHMQPKIAELERQLEAWRDNSTDQAMEYGKLDDVAVGMFKKIEELEGKLEEARITGMRDAFAIAAGLQQPRTIASFRKDLVRLSREQHEALDKIREGENGKAE